MKETPGQGRYFLPIQTLVENKQSESKHQNCFFNCSYEGGYIYGEPDVSIHDDSTNVPLPEEDPLCDDSVYFLPKDSLMEELKTPFVIDDFQPVEVPQNEPEEVIPEDIQEEESLSSLEYEDNKYVSLKVRVVCRKLRIRFLNRFFFAKALVIDTCKKSKWNKTEDLSSENEAYQEFNQENISFQSKIVKDSYSIDELLNTISNGKLGTAIEMEFSHLPMDCSATDQCQAVRNILVHAIESLFHVDKSNFKSIKLQMGREGRRFSGGLLTAVDSIELLSKTSHRCSLIAKPTSTPAKAAETSKKFTSEIFHLKHKPKPFIELSNEEYLKSFQGVPRYLQNPGHRLFSLWDYRPTDNTEWNDLFDRIQAGQETDADRQSEDGKGFNEIDDDIVRITCQGILKKSHRH